MTNKMKFSRLLFLSLAFAATLLTGCKKDEEEDTKPYMNGSVELDIDAYMEPFQSKTFNVDTLSTLSLNEAGGIGYFLKLPGETKRDTIKTLNGDFKFKEFTVTAPDELGTFNAVYGGFAEGYYETAKTAYFVVVRRGLNGDASLTDFEIADTDKSFTDARDGKTYYYTTVEGTDWMRQNLSWSGAGIAHSGLEVMGDIFGRFYTWDEAQTACPEGWRLASDEDWVKLGGKYGTSSAAGSDIKGAAGHLMENVSFNGDRLWEYWREVKIDNSARLSLLPAGYALNDGETTSYEGLKSYAMFWLTGSEDDMGAYRYISEQKNDVYYGLADKETFRASVRCVR